MAYSKNNASRDIRKSLSPLSISGSSSSSSSYTSMADNPYKLTLPRRNPSPYSSDSSASTSTQDRDLERRLQPQQSYTSPRKSSSKSGGKSVLVHNNSKSVPDKVRVIDGRYYNEPGKGSSSNFDNMDRDGELVRWADERERSFKQGAYPAGVVSKIKG